MRTLLIAAVGAFPATTTWMAWVIAKRVREDDSVLHRSDDQIVVAMALEKKQEKVAA
jgi:hypothetical protein